MADGISFDVSLGLNCTDLYKRGGGAYKPDSNCQILELRVRSVRSAYLSYSQEMAVASSDNLAILLVRTLNPKKCNFNAPAIRKKIFSKFDKYSILAL